MRFRLAVFAKIAMDGCALGEVVLRCKPVYRVFCKVFYRRSGKMYLPNRLRLQGLTLGEIPISPIFFSSAPMKKDLEELLLQGL